MERNPIEEKTGAGKDYIRNNKMKIPGIIFFGIVDCVMVITKIRKIS